MYEIHRYENQDSTSESDIVSNAYSSASGKLLFDTLTKELKPLAGEN